MRILALDPGTDLTGWAELLDGAVLASGVEPNETTLARLRVRSCPDQTLLAVEMIASYGMPVGRETFETVLWIGRFLEAWHSRGGKVRLVYRREVKRHLCGTDRAKDPHVRQALKDLYGGTAAVGRKASPGPLYGVKSHSWSALAVGVTAAAGIGQEVEA